jgi:hypothetical protein
MTTTVLGQSCGVWGERLAAVLGGGAVRIRRPVVYELADRVVASLGRSGRPSVTRVLEGVRAVADVRLVLPPPPEGVCWRPTCGGLAVAVGRSGPPGPTLETWIEPVVTDEAGRRVVAAALADEGLPAADAGPATADELAVELDLLDATYHFESEGVMAEIVLDVWARPR